MTERPITLEPSYTDPQGRVWRLYPVNFESPDCGGQFSVYLYAISKYHAALQVEALKETAALDDPLVGTYSTETED